MKAEEELSEQPTPLRGSGAPRSAAALGPFRPPPPAPSAIIDNPPSQRKRSIPALTQDGTNLLAEPPRGGRPGRAGQPRPLPSHRARTPGPEGRGSTAPPRRRRFQPAALGCCTALGGDARGGGSRSNRRDVVRSGARAPLPTLRVAVGGGRAEEKGGRAAGAVRRRAGSVLSCIEEGAGGSRLKRPHSGLLYPEGIFNERILAL